MEREPDKDTKESKVKPKNRRFAAPIPLVPVEKPLPKRPERHALDERLAKLSVHNADVSDKKEPETAESPQEKTKRFIAETPEAIVSKVSETGLNVLADKQEDETAAPEYDEQTEANETYEPLEWYEPPATVLNSGEILLNSDTPFTERTINLRGESKIELAVPIQRGIVQEERSQPPDMVQPERQMEVLNTVTDSSIGPMATEFSGNLPPALPEIPPPFMPLPDVPHSEVSSEQYQSQAEEIYTPDAVRQIDMYPFSPASERPASKQDVKDALYQAEKVGQNRGVLTGLLVGGTYEHFKHKRREKKQEKRFDRQTKQLEQARKEYTFGHQEHVKKVSQAQREHLELQQRLESVVHEKVPQQPIIPQEQLRIPEDHRLETSAWHTIEVDAKTGKAVEKPTFQYGHEYYRERAQETVSADQQRIAAAGEVALVAAAGVAAQAADNQSTSDSSPTSDAQIPLATTQSAPTAKSGQKAKEALQSVTKTVNGTAPMWPWIVALAVIVMVLILLVH